MSAADTKMAIDRLASKRNELGPEDFGAYAFLALGILAGNAPEVVQFVLDRADETLTGAPADKGGES